MGNEAKGEYFRGMDEPYQQAERQGRAGLRDEFCLRTGYNRKYAIRLLNGPRPGKARVRRPRGRKPRYGKQVVSRLTAVWEAAGYSWWVRRKALLPNWMPWIGKGFRLSPELEKERLTMSARPADGPPVVEPETRTEAQDLRADQARSTVEAPHPSEDGQLGRTDPWLLPRSTWWRTPAIRARTSSPTR